MRGLRNVSPLRIRIRIRIGIGLILLVGLITGVGGIVVSDDRPPIGEAPPINNSTTPGEKVGAQSQSVTDPPQTYAVTARSEDAIDTTQLAAYGEVGTQADARVELRMSPADVPTVQNISWVTNVRPVIRSKPAQVGTDIPGSSSGSRGSLGVQQAHQKGITGEDVKIGIIDAGFNPTNQAIASNVVETRSFRRSQGPRAHGTSVAEIVTRTAPDNQLFFASTATATDTEAAINYLHRQDVDIIVHSVGFPAFEDDGTHILADNINAVTGSGTLFVNAAGNAAQTHWEGEFRDTDEDDTHEWTVSGDELNALPSSNSDVSGGQVSVIVRWKNDGDSSDYKPYLYNPVTETYILEGEAGLRTETNQLARLSAEVDQQPLSLVIENTQGPANDEIEVIVYEGPEQIQRTIPASSIFAPADVPAALAVAAYERGPTQLAPYSSRGPTDDGRTGIDVTGYTNIEVTNGFYESGVFGGTSAAAPYAAGVAALVEDDQPGDQSPTELAKTLTSSTDDIRDLGTDTASGSGVVNVVDAVDVESAETPTPTPTPDNTTSGPTTQRTLSTTEVTNGSIMTVTIEGSFDTPIDDAKVVDSVSGGGIVAGNLSLTERNGADFGVITSEPAVDLTWNSQLGTGLDSDSVRIEYELTVPANTPLGTTITFDGTVTNTEADETAAIGGDSQLEVVSAASATPETVTVGNQEVPTEFTSETDSGERTVTADNAVSAINTFIEGGASADVAVNVINAFIASS